MKIFFSICALMACALMGIANASVTISFTHPEGYTGKFADYGLYARHDIRDYGKERVLNSLARHFDKLGAKLPAGQDLKIEVLDVRLAGSGRSNPYQVGGMDPEMITVHWPAITLRYSLEANGAVLKSGEEHVKDMAPSCRGVNYGEILCAEKQMLNRWFKETLLAKSGT